jgi:dTDP-glucose 4,6-dehydratase
LGLAKQKNARILIASTSEVYGNPEVHPQVEEYVGHVDAIGTRGVYDEAKRFQESITMAYHRVHKLETRIARIFNTYGPKMRLNDGRAIPTFIGQALRNENLTVFGNGSQTRSFCYIDDQIEGIYQLLLSEFPEPVNLGNPEEISVLEFAEEILQLNQGKQEIIFKPLPEDDPARRQPDISRAKKWLNWQPKVNRKEGIQKTFNYFKQFSKEELNKKEHKDFSAHNRK